MNFSFQVDLILEKQLRNYGIIIIIIITAEHILKIISYGVIVWPLGYNSVMSHITGVASYGS